MLAPSGPLNLGQTTALSDRAVDSHVKNIRKKIAAIDPSLEAITSIYGVGYRLEIE